MKIASSFSVYCRVLFELGLYFWCNVSAYAFQNVLKFNSYRAELLKPSSHDEKRSGGADRNRD